MNTHPSRSLCPDKLVGITSLFVSFRMKQVLGSRTKRFSPFIVVGIQIPTACNLFKGPGFHTALSAPAQGCRDEREIGAYCLKLTHLMGPDTASPRGASFPMWSRSTEL